MSECVLFINVRGKVRCNVRRLKDLEIVFVSRVTITITRGDTSVNAFWA